MVTEAVTLAGYSAKTHARSHCVCVGSSTFSSQYEILSPDTNLVSFPALEAAIFQANRHGVVSLSSHMHVNPVAVTLRVRLRF